MPCVLNASNEIAVEYFLNEKIEFNDIPKIVYKTMEYYKNKNKLDYSLEDVLQSDKFARDYAKNLVLSKDF